MTNQSIVYPSIHHEAFVEYLHAKCLDMKLGLAIKGSISKGTAKRYSDIDVLVFGLADGCNIDSLIAFRPPLMLNMTERPPGIVIVYYQLGICVDLDLRKNATIAEMEDAIILLNNGIVHVKDHVERITIESRYLLVNPLHKYLRLLHRAILKYLCQKHNDALDLLTELNQGIGQMGIKCIPPGTDFVHDAKLMYENMKTTCVVEENLDNEFKYLIEQLKCA